MYINVQISQNSMRKIFMPRKLGKQWNILCVFIQLFVLFTLLFSIYIFNFRDFVIPILFVYI